MSEANKSASLKSKRNTSNDRIEMKNLENSELVFSEILFDNSPVDSPENKSDELQSFTQTLEENKPNEDELKSSTLFQLFKQDSFGETWDVVPWDQIRDYKVGYRFASFIQFFIIYFSFYFFLGPLLPIALSPVYGIKFFRNITLWGFNKYVMRSYLMFFAHAIATTLYFSEQYPFIGGKQESIGLIEICFMYWGMFLKIVHMSNKFALMSNERLTHYYRENLTKLQICRDIYEGAWLYQCDNLVYDEIVDALLRYDVELRTFNFSFLVDVSEETANRLVSHMLNLSKYHTRDWIPFEAEPLYNAENKCSYYGAFIFYDILSNFEKGKKTTKTLWIQTIYALFIALIPILYRLIFIQSTIYNDFTTWAIAICLLFNNFWNTYKFSYTICSGFLNDLKRKKFCLIQAAHMLTAKNGEELFSVNKLLPTIDLFCSYNLKAWSILRHLCLDYGKRFQFRVEGLFSMLFISFLVQFVLLILGSFSVIQFNNISMLILFFKTITEMTFIVSILIYGAAINSTFIFHQNILERAKKITLDMYYFSKFYNEETVKDATNAIVKFGFYQKSLFFENLKILSPHLTPHEMEKIYEEKTLVTINIFERNIEELKIDMEMNPFQIMGINISYSLLQSAAMGLVSLIGVGLQSYIQTSKKK